MSLILAVAKNRLMNLKRDRAAFVLAFVLPVAFFTIFASIFAGSGKALTRKIPVAIVDEDGSDVSRRFVAGLQAEAGLSVGLKPGDENAPGPLYTAAQAEEAVRKGDVPVALVIPKGFGARPDRLRPGSDARRPPDPRRHGRPRRAAGAQRNPAEGRNDVPAGGDGAIGNGGAREVERRIDAGTEGAHGVGDPPDRRGAPAGSAPASSARAGASGGGGLVAVETKDVLGETKKNPTVTFYAAGLGVMFLLFSAAGAGGALIEEAESGTLDRILATRVSMTKLLLGKLLYLGGVGVVQLVLMFVWGALLFGLELWSHIPGFVIMTVATSLACSAFGLMLASVCHSRMQLVALSNLAILLMSALGGSLFPRFLMSEKLQKIGLVTLNAWALDGFQKIFWRDAPLWTIWPQVTVLVGLGVAFFLIARRVAERWEAA